MKKSIWKYEITDGEGTQTLIVPHGAELLSIENSRGGVCMWFLLDLNVKEKEEIKLHTFGTGSLIHPAEKLKYMGSYKSDGGFFVWHVFREINM